MLDALEGIYLDAALSSAERLEAMQLTLAILAGKQKPPKKDRIKSGDVTDALAEIRKLSEETK